jgi:hypothetical protein
MGRYYFGLLKHLQFLIYNSYGACRGGSEIWTKCQPVLCCLLINKNLWHRHTKHGMWLQVLQMSGYAIATKGGPPRR